MGEKSQFFEIAEQIFDAITGWGGLILLFFILLGLWILDGERHKNDLRRYNKDPGS